MNIDTNIKSYVVLSYKSRDSIIFLFIILKWKNMETKLFSIVCATFQRARLSITKIKHNFNYP